MPAFASLTLVTCLGFLIRRMSPGRFAQFYIRWILSFVDFLPTAYLAGVSRGVEHWPRERAILAFGTACFAIMALWSHPGSTRANRCRR